MNEYFEEQEILGKAYDSKLMIRLLKYAKPHLKGIIVAIILIFLIIIGKLLNPYIIKNAIDKSIDPFVIMKIQGKEERVYLIDNEKFIRKYPIRFYNGKLYILERDFKKIPKEDISILRAKDYKILRNSVLLYFLISFLIFILSYVQVYILHLTSQRIIYDMRKDIFSHLLKLSMSFFDRNPIGRLVTRVTNDTETIQEMYNSVITSVVVDVFLIFGLSIFMFILNWKLAFIVISSLPIVGYISYIFRKYARKAYRDFRVRLALLNSYLSEHINGIRITELFAREDENEKEFNKINNSLLDAQLKFILVNAIFRPLVNALGNFFTAFIIFFGGLQFLKNKITFGMLFLFISYLDTFFRPIQDLAEKYDILQNAMASSERIFLLLDEPILIKSPENPIILKKLRGKIEFKNVWFAYDKEWILKDISFNIEPGEKVAFVGATGAGKTSIINLIPRFYDVQKGEILIDGINIKNLSIEELRRNISIVLQDIYLFATDILHNIRLNREDISEEKVREYVKIINSEDFILKLPLGYKTPVQERGANLSTGQRQLISFARALIFDPKILILDEATSNIDTEMEKFIEFAIKKLMEGRTSIIIAHRLSSIKNVDTIYVIHKGRIVEKGNHQELIRKKGFYYNLYKLQNIDYYLNIK